ncbi:MULTISPECIES: hypothetical protein [Staphylococcus]|uniref:hypothetical protein n=1 Tax=Staphylococcus TaxID=1279 RepID=UPI00036620D9|nr:MULTISPECIES: hypothetical protein [Staphylococcus]ANS89880.1 hypothetical protein A6M57_7820 [Staphylococcus pseudintermedius]EHL7177761.1 hypothetical protein [Staphylococcus pseudintermedius]EHP0479146.1 hypothetical protein [Staphylococcus pseudintermedius]EHP0518147.1 hypothetical protein [Staphylococcus pseudintermedius]EHT3102567.1 hypothetical protein [Staphylococcus pseudintermedius]
MAKFKVLKPYKDLELDKKLIENQEVEMTIKRSEEVEKTLSEKGFDGPFLERIQEKKK